MAVRDKLLARMRANPRGDWRIDQLKTIADRHGIAHRQRGTNHVTFRPQSGDKLTVPAARPIKSIYVRRFVALIDALESDDDDRARLSVSDPSPER